MQLHLVETIDGIFALDEKCNIIADQIWPRDPRTVANIMIRLRNGENNLISKLVSKIELLGDVKIYSNNQLLPIGE